LSGNNGIIFLALTQKPNDASKIETCEGVSYSQQMTFGTTMYSEQKFERRKNDV